MISTPSYFSSFINHLPSMWGTDQKKPPIQTRGENTIFFDFCSIHYWELKTPELVQTYMSDLMQQLSDAHITQINLSFAQIDNIQNLLLDNNPDPKKNLFGYIVHENPGLLEAFVSKASESGIQVKLSFGGQSSTAKAMKICTGKQTPESQANRLFQLVELYKLDGVDFDLEGEGATNFIQQNKTTALPFLRRLHQHLSGKGYTLSLTTNVNHSVIDILSLLFFDSKKKVRIDKFFDAINLMSYDSGEKYYIDASDQDAPGVVWGLKKWIETIPQEKSSLIHIGFQDATPYENPEASAGKKYTLQTKDRGTAASEIYKQCITDLFPSDSASTLGNPFWWPAEGTMQSRYNVGANGHTNFQVVTIKSFYDNQAGSYFSRLYRKFFN